MMETTEAVDLFAFDNSYARLPDRFFARLQPTPVAAPGLIRLNEMLAWHLKLDPGALATPEGVEILAGNWVPKGAEPLAVAYALAETDTSDTYDPVRYTLRSWEGLRLRDLSDVIRMLRAGRGHL